MVNPGTIGRKIETRCRNSQRAYEISSEAAGSRVNGLIRRDHADSFFITARRR